MRAGKRTIFGKLTISVKKQNELDPYLASIYPVYSLVSHMVNPFMDYGQDIPSSLPFIVDVTYVPEGEEDFVQIDILHHVKAEIIMFLWKTLDKNGNHLFLRHRNSTWKLKITKSHLFHFEYNPVKRELHCHEGILDKFMGWPENRRSLELLFRDLDAVCTKSRNVSTLPFKYIMKVSTTFLKEMDVDIEGVTQKDKRTLLHYAAKIDNQFLNYLLPKFKNIDSADKNGLTPLHLACEAGLYENAKTLLEWGADVNKLTKTGNSCLMVLSQRKHHDVKFFKLLLRHNAACDLYNNENMRAVDFVREKNKSNSVIKLIHPMFSQL